MRLSTQLLIGIVGITVLSQIVLGLNAYWIVVDTDKHHVLEVMQQRANDVAENVAIPLVMGEPHDAALEQSRRHFAPSTDLALIIDQKGVVAIAGPSRQTIDTAALFQTVTHLEQEAEEHRGEIHVAEENFVWLSAPIAGLPYRLILLEKHEIRHGSMQTTLKNRFLTSSIIIIWCAVWIALLLGSLMSRKLQEKSQAIRYQITHDAVTGLSNRALLYERLSETTGQSDEYAISVALLVFGINRFREINDTLGHNLGDQLLLETSALIQQTLPENGYIYRLRGDEFAILLNDATEKQATEYARHILESTQQPVTINQLELKIDLSIGIALFPQHTEDHESLIRYADIAMHKASEYGSPIAVYDGNQDEHSLDRLTLSAELHKAIADGQLVLHYQPKVSLTTGTVSGLEALVRWEHPTRGLVPPDEFITLAEQTGAIGPLTDWVIEEALFFLRRLHGKGIPIGIAVNISTRSLHDTLLSSRITDLLIRTGIASHFLTLEITESVMMHDINHAQVILESLHDNGIKISIDDFGTGFSSLAYLNRLPVDELKVDRGFVTRMSDKSNDRSIVQSIIELAHTLGCQVVAEGVEDGETQAILLNMGCDITQGYYISRPQSADAIEQWLDNNGSIAVPTTEKDSSCRTA